VVKTRELETARWIAITAVLIAVGLWAWRHNQVATRYVLRGTIICLAIGFFGYLYVRCLATIVSGKRPTYRTNDMFMLSTALARLLRSPDPDCDSESLGGPTTAAWSSTTNAA
jgi:hypothetical protein